MYFLKSLISILGGFFQSLLLQFEQQIANLFQFLGNQIGGYFLYWGQSFNAYGPLIPALFVGVVGISIGGSLAEFVLLDGMNKVVGG